jgi:hypothetical protein
MVVITTVGGILNFLVVRPHRGRLANQRGIEEPHSAS